MLITISETSSCTGCGLGQNKYKLNGVALAALFSLHKMASLKQHMYNFYS